MPSISYTNFAIHTIIAISIWLIIEYLRDYVENITLRSGRYLPFRTLFLKFEIVAEPIIAIHLMGKLIFLNLIFHSAVSIVLIAVFFTTIRNYMNGRVVLFRSLIKTGEEILYQKKKGKIIKRDRLGITIITNYDRFYVNYSNLLIKGFSLTERTNSVKFSFLKFEINEKVNLSKLKQKIFDILINLPYLDHSFTPELLVYPQQTYITAKFLLHESSDINAVIKLLKEKKIIAQIAAPNKKYKLNTSEKNKF